MPAKTQKPQADLDPLPAFLTQVRREFGAESILEVGTTERVQVEVIPTGSIALDLALGIGGLPRGRIVEIYGPNSSGKTTMALHAIANAQRAGGVALMIDAEHAVDPVYAVNLGVDMNRLLLSQPDNGEQGLEIADMAAKSGAVALVVVDSVAALVPKAEIEGAMGESHMGLHARLMSQALRKITGSLSATKTTVLFTNQLREKIGVVFGNPEVTTGGKALPFYASVRLDIRRISAIKDPKSGMELGCRTRIKVVKNKLSPPWRQVETEIVYGRGIRRVAELLDLGVGAGVFGKNGSYYSYGGQVFANGKEAAIQVLAATPDSQLAEIEMAIRQHAAAVEASLLQPASSPQLPAVSPNENGTGATIDLTSNSLRSSGVGGSMSTKVGGT